jgi:hypothetical protein
MDDRWEVPPLLRAILAIVKANDLDIGEGWGYGTPAEDREDEETETVFHDLLAGDGESVKHWIQQLGLMQPCVRSDLQRLSKEKPGSPRKSGPLEFKAAYPVIFAALEATFGLMPSNTRIAEQAHGGMRDALHAGVSLLSTDSSRTYIMGDEYYAREDRRNCVREREAAAGKSKSRKRSIKHDDLKPEQEMAGKQLLASGAKYEANEIALLPLEFRNEIGVKAIAKKGMLYKDKEIERQKAEHAEEKHARRTAVPLTMDALVKIAALTAVGNDSTWENPAKVLRTQDLERLASKKFWKELKVKDGFKDILKVVLPNFWKDSMAEEKVKKTKLMLEIGTHLQLVNDVANKRVHNSLSEVDISTMTRSDILSLFVKQDATTCLSDGRAETKMRHKLTAALISSGGTEINQRYVLATDLDLDYDSDDDLDDDSDDVLDDVLDDDGR